MQSALVGVASIMEKNKQSLNVYKGWIMYKSIAWQNWRNLIVLTICITVVLKSESCWKKLYKYFYLKYVFAKTKYFLHTWRESIRGCVTIEFSEERGSNKTEHILSPQFWILVGLASRFPNLNKNSKLWHQQYRYAKFN